MKQTRRIDDILVDEAAAATKPELCIPFHLQPTRLLAVGDPPLQLPALVVSLHAMELGLAKSLHQRLMKDCGDEEHTMQQLYKPRGRSWSYTIKLLRLPRLPALDKKQKRL